MKFTETIKRIFRRDKKTPYTGAVLLAAGGSRRMNGLDKQFLCVGGTPVLIRSIENFEKAETINEIVVVTQKEKIPLFSALFGEYDFHKIKAVVAGGETRSDSVRMGIAALSEECDFIALHDGARPFADAALIDKVSRCAYKNGAALPCLPVTSTVKRVDKNGRITETVDRDTLRLAQTPQTFKAGLFRDLLLTDTQTDRTDDSMLFEKYGKPVFAVAGDEKNIKITTQADLILAEKIALEEEK